MRTTIDAAGRVVVPKPIRDRLRLVGPAEIEIEEQDGVIELRPVADEVRVVDTPDGPVATSERAAVLTDETVRTTLERIRE